MKNTLYRTYKTFIFFQPNLEKTAILEILKKSYKILLSKNSKFCIKNLGTKIFAYPIKGFSRAAFVEIIFNGNGELVEDINRQLSISDSIIRHITIKKEDK